jgi:O-antigen/teichoic acid export membrane protein
MYQETEIGQQQNKDTSDLHELAAPAQTSLLHHVSWTLTGNVVYVACQAGWLILISKLSTEESRGQFVLALSISAPVIFFSTVALRQVLATDVKHEFPFGVYLRIRLLTTGLAIAVIGTIAAVQWIDHRAAAVVLFLVGFAKAFESISDIVFGRMQQFERLDRVALSMVIKGLTSLVFLAFGLVITHDAIGAAAGIVLGFLITLLLVDIPSARLAAQHAARAGLLEHPDQTEGPLFLGDGSGWQLIRRAAPLAFASGLIVLNPNILIYFIGWTSGARSEELVGVYGSLNYLPQIGTIVVSALGVATATRLAKYYAEGNFHDFYRVAWWLVCFCLALGMLGALIAFVAGKEVLAVLFRSTDAKYAPVLVWIMLSAAISYVASILGFAVTATRIFQRFTVPYLMVTVVAIVASALLIPRFGLVGAAWAAGLMNLAACVAPIFILISLHSRYIHGTTPRSIGR